MSYIVLKMETKTNVYWKLMLFNLCSQEQAAVEQLWIFGE